MIPSHKHLVRYILNKGFTVVVTVKGSVVLNESTDYDTIVRTVQNNSPCTVHANHSMAAIFNNNGYYVANYSRNAFMSEWACDYKDSCDYEYPQPVTH